MERALLFFLAAIFLVSILYLFPVTPEGFECISVATHQKNLVINNDKNTELRSINPQLAQAGIGTIEPSPAPPTDLPLVRIEERAKGAPLPYRDPITEPAKYIRLKGMSDDLKAFLGFQAPSISDQCDPSVQLPLTTARADLVQIENAISVLDRNPGMSSPITNKQVRGIQDNLDYLKDEVRKFENSGLVEGFADTSNSTPATLQELKEFNVKVLIEKARIGVSGTTDTNIQARIATLDRIDADIKQIIDQVQGGQMNPSNIPIMVSDLDTAFPILGDVTKPLPRQLINSGLPDSITSLFPGGLSSSDTSTLNVLRDVLKSYSANPNSFTNTMNSIFNLNRNSTESRDQYLATMNNNSFGGTSSSLSEDMPPTNASVPDAQVYSVRGLPGANTSPNEEPGFNWKERAKIIGERIKMRGLNPKDYGVIDPTAEVSLDYSWRGYTKMICSRLLNTMDPGLPEYCGCPPYNWNGWTS